MAKDQKYSTARFAGTSPLRQGGFGQVLFPPSAKEEYDMSDKLVRLTERVWIYPYEEVRDRPNLGYIRGDRLSLAVDAGHSDAHIAEFHAALNAEGLPLPDLTVLTHWHWDHTFAMHKVHGLTLTNGHTDAHLRAFREMIQREGVEAFLSMDETIRREYSGGRPVVVTPADIVFSGGIDIDLGGCAVRAFEVESPHTDDGTFVLVPGEGVLFIGDANSGAFPTWQRDAAMAKKLADTIRALDARIVVEGHWTPTTTEDVVNDQLEG